MKIIVVLLFSLIALTTAQEYVAGKTVVKNRRSGRATTLDPADVCSRHSDYATYCTIEEVCENPNPAQIFTCMNNAVVIPAAACPANKPYCIGQPGAQFCSSVEDPTCNAPTVCNSPGYFPDPSNCYNYYYCFVNTTAGKFQSIPKQCPVGAPFTPAGPNNLKCRVRGACVKATCTAGRSAEWKAMNYYNFTKNRIAMKCVGGKMDYVHQCPTGLSVDTTYTPYARCTIQCVSNYQKAVYVGDNTKYYVCLLGKAYVETCEFGYIFNGATLNCEKSPETTVAPTTTSSTTTESTTTESTTTESTTTDSTTTESTTTTIL